MRGGKRCVETDPNDKMIINQIMLRYRPIAPRPVTAERSAGFAPLKEKRAKRKYVRVKKKKKPKIAEECINLTITDDDKGLMSLLHNRTEFVTADPLRKVPDWISFETNHYRNDMNNIGRWITPAVGLHDVDLAVTVTQPRLIESWVTVESVTGSTCEDNQVILNDLKTDSCPGFVSNGYDEVQWVNLAYRRMVDPETDGGDVMVWLEVKVGKDVFEYWSAFSCRVRVVYVLSEKRKQMMVPCDVWKVGCGGYAWRLDVKAALSLGRLSELVDDQNYQFSKQVPMML